MNEARGRSGRKGADHPLHFAPAAEMDDVTELAAFAGAAARFRNGMVAKTGQEFRGLGKRAAAGGMNLVTQENPPMCLLKWGVARKRLPNCCAAMVKSSLNSRSLRRGWPRRRRTGKARAMARRSKLTQAGGSIIAIAIIAGTVAGIIVGQPSIGILVGTGAGVLLALLFWLNERR